MAEALEQLVKEAISVKQQYVDKLFAMPNVVGIGIGYKIAGTRVTGELAITVSVSRKVASAQLAASEIIPKLIGSIKTDVVETGVFRAFQDPKKKMRPARPGVSIGHYNITAGTLGCLVKRGDDVLILSNNHVLADSNNAQLGDAILQPGKYDGGTDADKIAELAEYIPIAFNTNGGGKPGCLASILRLFGSQQDSVSINQPGDNHVDCAIAKPLSPDLVTPEILQIGKPVGAGAATLGTSVQKFGRTTSYTHDRITQVDVTATVDYGGPTAVFQGQLMAGAMSQGGDSGSAVLDDQKRVVGLLFAGSDSTTLMNPIQDVLTALNVEIVT
jgi:Trypsin-like peptidase domain